MASQKQIDANRRNAQKSTGPKTPEGKARVSRNALRHGLTAEVAIIEGEDENEFNQFQADFYDHLQPHGPVEAHLVQEVATAAWRLRRIHILETGVFDLRFVDLEKSMEEDYEDLTPHIRTAIVYRDDTSGPNTLDNLSRYQARAERSFYKALHELERLQSLRPATTAPPPSSEPRPLRLGSSSSPSPQPPEPQPLAARPDFCQTDPIAPLPAHESEPRAVASGSSPSSAPLPVPPPCISSPATPTEVRIPG
jgi:hypothetical protein